MPIIEDIDRLIHFEFLWGIQKHKHGRPVYPWKQHRAISMWYVHEGGSEVELKDGSRYTIRPGEIKLIGAGTAFREEIIRYPHACTSGALFRYRLYDSITLSEQLRLPVRVAGSRARRLKGPLLDMIASMPAAQALDLSALVRVKQCAMDILAVLLELSPEDVPSVLQSRGYSVLAPAIDFMYAHLAESISRAAIARSAHLSESALYKKFREQLHCSPMDYLLRLRIDKARQLLMQTSMNLAEIAEHTGFSSPYHLSNVFKKVRGQSPSEYRRSV